MRAHRAALLLLSLVACTRTQEDKGHSDDPARPAGTEYSLQVDATFTDRLPPTVVLTREPSDAWPGAYVLWPQRQQDDDASAFWLEEDGDHRTLCWRDGIEFGISIEVRRVSDSEWTGTAVSTTCMERSPEAWASLQLRGEP